jgi:Tfp pilus assembly protein PilF
LDAPFLSDDRPYIVENHLVRHPGWLREIFTSPYPADSLEQGLYRPLTVLSYAFNFRLGGLEPYGYHYLNLLLHLATSVLVGVLGHRLSGRRGVALVASFVFLLHPVHVEAVTWIVGRAEVLATLFALAAVLAAWDPRIGRVPGWRAVIAGLLFLGGLLSKETAVVTPGLLFLCQILDQRKEGWRRFFREHWWTYLALGLALVLYLAIRVWVLGALGPGGRLAWFHADTNWTRIWTVVVVVAYYIRLLVWPWPLVLQHPIEKFHTFWDPWVVGSVFGLVLVAVLAIWTYRRVPLAFTGLAWLAIGLFPFLHIVPIGMLMSERFIYLASVGFALFAAAGAQLVAREWGEARRGRFVVGGVVAALLLVYSAVVVVRNQEWRDPVVFWEKGVSRNPSSYWLWSGLAVTYARAGRFEEGRKAAMRGMALAPREAASHLTLASVLQYEGRCDAAAAFYQTVLSLEPPPIRGKLIEAHYNLGNCLFSQKRYEEAEVHYREALRLQPTLIEALNNLGNLYIALGRAGESFVFYQRCLDLHPDHITCMYNMALAHVRMGESKQAAGWLQRILDTAPDDRRSRMLLVQLHGSPGEEAAALAHLSGVRDMLEGPRSGR